MRTGHPAGASPVARTTARAWRRDRPAGARCWPFARSGRIPKSRWWPVQKSMTSSNSVDIIWSGTRCGSTMTAPPGRNENRLSPPNAAAYWSCLPIGWPSTSISTMAGLLGQLTGRHPLAAKGVQGIEQPDCEAARAAEAGRGREVANRADVDRRLDRQEAKPFAGDVVAHFVDRVHLLRLGVVEPDRLVEHLAVTLDRDVDVLVDRGAQDRAVVALVEGRQVGSAAGEADRGAASG